MLCDSVVVVFLTLFGRGLIVVGGRGGLARRLWFWSGWMASLWRHGSGAMGVVGQNGVVRGDDAWWRFEKSGFGEYSG